MSRVEELERRVEELESKLRGSNKRRRETTTKYIVTYTAHDDWGRTFKEVFRTHAGALEKKENLIRRADVTNVELNIK